MSWVEGHWLNLKAKHNSQTCHLMKEGERWQDSTNCSSFHLPKKIYIDNCNPIYQIKQRRECDLLHGGERRWKGWLHSWQLIRIHGQWIKKEPYNKEPKPLKEMELSDTDKVHRNNIFKWPATAPSSVLHIVGPH